MQKFDDLTEPPVVGRFYLVPTVIGTWHGKDGPWPVMGVKHEDAEWLSFPWLHYHLNRFFVNEEEEYRAVRSPLTENTGYLSNSPLPAPFLRKWKCRRSIVAKFPTENIPPKDRRAHMWWEMFDHFTGVQCKRSSGWVCPHKGARLGAIIPIGGVITCPLHGMRIDARTGIVLSQAKET